MMSIQVDLLKHGIPDPSSTTLSHPQTSSDKENANKLVESGDEYMATRIFVHTRVHDQDNTPWNFQVISRLLQNWYQNSIISPPYLLGRYIWIKFSFCLSCDSFFKVC